MNTKEVVDDSNALTLDAAKAFYGEEKYYISQSGSRVSRTEFKGNWFYQNDIDVNWQSNIQLQIDSISVVYADISTRDLLYAAWIEENDTTIVKVPQGLAVIESMNDKRISQYLVSLIPTAECNNVYEDKLMEKFYKGEINDYSGFVAYTDIYTGIPVFLMEYDNRLLIDNLYMVSKSDNERILKETLAKNMFRNIRMHRDNTKSSRSFCPKESTQDFDDDFSSTGGGGSWNTTFNGDFVYTKGDGKYSALGFFPEVVLTAPKKIHI